MGLRTKAWLFFGVGLIGLVVAVLLILELGVLRRFASFEESSLRRDVHRALRTVEAEAAHLDTIVLDWAEWDPSYDFLDTGDVDFVRTNLNDDTFRSLDVSLVAYVRGSGAVTWGQVFDETTEHAAPIPPAVRERLVETVKVLLSQRRTGRARGVCLFPDTTRLLAMRPILRSDGSGPSNGVLVMGRTLERELLAHLGATLDLDLALQRADALAFGSDFAGVAPRLDAGKRIGTLAPSERTISGYGLLQDLLGRPAGILRVTQDREIAAHGRAIARYLLLSLVAAMVVTALAVQLVLERGVISRLATLGERLREIGRRADASARVVASGRDEVTQLAGGINSMLGDLQRAEASVRASEERYRAIVEDQAELICRWRPATGTLVFANRAFRHFFGLPGDTPSDGGADGALGDAPSGLVQAARSVSRAEQATTFVLAHPCSGAARWVQWSNRALAAPDSDLLEVQSVGRDVTRQRLLEETLTHSEREACQLLQGPNEVSLLTDLGGSVLASTQATASRLGLTLARVVGARMAELMGPEGATRWRSNAEQAIATGAPALYQERIGGRSFMVAIVPSPRSPGLAEHLATVAHDITDSQRAEQAEQRLSLATSRAEELQGELRERTRLEEALRDAQTAFLEMSRSVNSVVWITDVASGRVTYVSPGYEHIWGRTSESLYEDSTSFLAGIHPDDRSVVAGGTESGSPVPLAEVELRVMRPDGSQRWVRHRRLRLAGASEESGKVISLAEDISDRKAMEEASRRLEAQLRLLARRLDDAREEERRKLATWIHDEIGQMLTALRMDLTWLHKRLHPRAPELQQAFAEMDAMIAHNVGAVQLVCAELRPAVLADLGPLAAIEWLVDQFRRRSQIRITFTAAAEDAQLPEGVSLTLFRIVQEALTNIARHAGATAAHVELTAAEGEVVLRISDDGRGVRAEEISGARALGILGMRERVLAHGGQLDVGRGPAGGTVVTARIRHAWVPA